MKKSELISYVKDMEKIGRGRVFPQKIKNEIMKHYFLVGKMNDNEMLKEMNMFPATIFKWRKDAIQNLKQTKTKALNVNSSSGKGRTIGSSLSRILKNIPERDVITQIDMIDILKESGFKQEAIIDHLITPSREEFEQIMHAVRLLSKNYELKLKE